ncbi:adenylate kinase family protein [Buchnera aphidicola]|uniref:adenylate kinase family protein n=1 Tax=Buchnera aphidicola TaxID=9 RepID=UPI003463CBA0
MKIIFFGPPGSGKGTQSELIKKKMKIPQISTGNILRQAIQSKHKTGKKISNCINQGILVDDSIIIHLIKKRIKKKDCESGFILDGFPRTLKQAIEMTKEKIIIDYFIEFYISEKIIYDRILGRRIHIPSGRTYHIKFNPPKKSERDDITNEKLTVREDDKKEVISKRIIEYKKNKNNIIEYYKKIPDTKYYKIQACQNQKNIYKKLKKIFMQ